jgi:Holliday junction resolvasome RuvABC endonuclease subunit
MTTPEVFGMDLSLRAPGLTLPNGQWLTINTGIPDTGTQRLVVYRKHLMSYLRQFVPVLAVIEKIPTGGKGFKVALSLAWVHGVTLECLGEFNIPHAYIDNRVLKLYATGNGAASKAGVIAAAERAAGGRRPDDDNQADSWWLRAMGLRWLGHPIDEEIGQMDVGGGALRDACVRRPGCEWPGQPVKAAAPHLTRPGHPGRR